LTAVLTAPDADGRIVVVNITSRTERTDSTVILNVGDHKRIIHASSVAYDWMDFAATATIAASVRDGDLVPREDMDPYVLEVIQRGACRTRRAARIVKRFCCALFCPCPRPVEELVGCPECEDCADARVPA